METEKITPSIRKKRSVLLDIIRCIAMLGVVAVHLTMYLPTGKLGHYMSYGKYGVQIFFVLSGFLGAATYPNALGSAAYWKKRVFRILPAYYVAVILGLFIHTVLLKNIPANSFCGALLRYMFGLNMILPSSNFDVWNNMYGLWSMNCFIVFYILAPFIMKYVSSLKKSLLLFVGSLLIWAIWKIVSRNLLGAEYGWEYVDMLAGNSPFGKLYQLCMGIVVYHFIQTQKKWEGICFFAMCLAAAIILERSDIIWCSLAAIMIIAALAIEEKQQFRETSSIAVIKYLSNESYHIYLSHMIAFDLARIASEKWLSKYDNLRTVLWLFLATVILTGICAWMHFAEKWFQRICSSEKKRIP